MQLQPEPGAREAVRPHLRVLAVAAVGLRQPLPVQVLGDRAVEPGERVLAVAHDVERVVPAIVARRAQVQSEHDEEEALEEQVAVGADRVHLQAPGLDAVRGPSRHVVVTPEVLGDEDAVEVRIAGPVGVVADLRQPVPRRPPSGVPEDQLVEDAGVDLTPRRGAVGHQRDRVGRVDEVEPVPAQHRRVAVIVPVRVRLPGAVPVVGRRRLAVQVAEPALGPLVEDGWALPGTGHAQQSLSHLPRGHSTIRMVEFGPHPS